MTDKELIAALELLADQSEGRSHRAMLVARAARRLEELSTRADFDPVAWLKQYGELQAASQNKIRLVGEFCQVVLNEAADAMAEEIARKKK